MDPLQMPSAYTADVSPTQSRRTGREPPAPPRNVSGTAATIGPGECASRPGLDDEALARQEAGWDPSPGEGEIPTCFSGDVFDDTHPASSRVSMDTAALDLIQEYCTRDIVFFWQPSSCFSQWTRSRFSVEGISYSCGEQFFAAEKSHLFRNHQTLQHIVHVPDTRLHKKYGREVRNFDLAVWERERENIVLVCSYATFAQNPAMRTHLLDTGDQLFAEASPYDLI